MKRNLLGFVMRYGTNKEKNTKLGEGFRRLAKESHGMRKKKTTHLSLPIDIVQNPYTVLSFLCDSPVRPCFFNISNKRRPLLIIVG